MRGEETILLAEDEPSLRRFVRTVLEERGFTVLEAQDGPSAIELGTRHGKHIDLLLTDLVMPGMSGREAAERLRGLIPDLRVLYVSGHTDDAIIRQGIETRSVPFMHKPFGAAALVAKVREVLDGPVVRAGADVLP